MKFKGFKGASFGITALLFIGGFLESGFGMDRSSSGSSSESSSESDSDYDDKAYREMKQHIAEIKNQYKAILKNTKNSDSLENLECKIAVGEKELSLLHKKEHESYEKYRSFLEQNEKANEEDEKNNRALIQYAQEIKLDELATIKNKRNVENHIFLVDSWAMEEDQEELESLRAKLEHLRIKSEELRSELQISKKKFINTSEKIKKYKECKIEITCLLLSARDAFSKKKIALSLLKRQANQVIAEMIAEIKNHEQKENEAKSHTTIFINKKNNEDEQ